jgi:transposase
MDLATDVWKGGLDVHVLPGGERFAVSRDATGLDELADRLTAHSRRAVAIEAAGGLKAVVGAVLGAAGLPVVVVNPAQVRAFARALGRRAKTDLIDAALIAGFTAATAPAVRPLPGAATRLLGGLVARRRWRGVRGRSCALRPGVRHACRSRSWHGPHDMRSTAIAVASPPPMHRLAMPRFSP